MVPSTVLSLGADSGGGGAAQAEPSEALEYGLVDHVVQTAGQVTGGGGTTA